jgi:indolepyruvate ferredoxin oxidoreductase beta subunit
MDVGLPTERDRITIAILALGGQGGGVLADWILELANRNGYVAQGTSVPGVAQRTGSTVYYIEMIRRADAGANRPEPVLAMMPVPGDVDIVIASELMEAGRAILRGFVSEDRTTLIGSTHRIYAISEKSAQGDGTGSSQRILDAATRRAKRFIGFDMDAAATSSGSVISSIMFGALAGSGALPFPHEMFEAAIQHGGKAVAANLRGFGAGLESARSVVPAAGVVAGPAEPTSEAGRVLAERIRMSLPKPSHAFALEGVRRLMDYQDRAYAEFYLDRLERTCAFDNGAEGFRFSIETARSLARWMSYEDTIRVADLKVRATRIARVENEVGVKADQTLSVTEYMHPRLREVCETMPARAGRWILARPAMCRRLEPFFGRGRHVRTTGLRWFLLLRMLAALRSIRRSTLRYSEEQGRIEEWLGLIREAAVRDIAVAAEIAASQRLIKGYSDTFERGLARFESIQTAARALIGQGGAAHRVRTLVDAALADEKGKHLSELLASG